MPPTAMEPRYDVASLDNLFEFHGATIDACHALTGAMLDTGRLATLAAGERVLGWLGGAADPLAHTAHIGESQARAARDLAAVHARWAECLEVQIHFNLARMRELLASAAPWQSDPADGGGTTPHAGPAAAVLPRDGASASPARGTGRQRAA